MPFGVRRATVSGVFPVSSSRAAPAAPSAAQVPVAAAQQLLPAADVVLKLGFRRLWGAEQGFVLLPAQVVKGLDVLRRKGFFGRQHAGNALR